MPPAVRQPRPREGAMKSFICLVLLAAATAAAAQPRTVTSDARRSASPALAVVGASIGMSPEQVSAAMTREGYARTGFSRDVAWDDLVARTIAQTRGVTLPRSGGMVVVREFYERGEEQITVAYATMPTGQVASEIIYSVPTSAIDEGSFRAAVLARYGRPSIAGHWEIVYCSRGERACSFADIFGRQLPNITAHTAFVTSRMITLREGAAASVPRQRLLRAEIERRSPQLRQPTF